MAQTTAKTRISPSKSTRHGHVFQPESRAYFAWLEGRLDPGALNQLEAGKFFPETEAGLRDSVAPTDEPNQKPPADGQIASAGQPASQFLDEPRTDWQKHEVSPGKTFTVSWDYSARHVTRRWNYFITKQDWVPTEPLSRAQFEDKPFYQVELTEQPHWSYTEALMPPKPTVHELMLPIRTGYQVLLAIWEVANTGNAFYQVIDLDFVDDGSSEPETPPKSPTDLRLVSVSDNKVALTWNAATAGTWPLAQHIVYRNGTAIAFIEEGENQYTDLSVLPSTKYTYYVTGLDTHGNESLPSASLDVITSSSGGNINTPPTAPVNLHSMNTTANSVELMWEPSISNGELANYIIYRDGQEIARVPSTTLSYTDSSLSPATRYRYFVAAIDTNDQLSVPGNVLAVTTTNDTGGGDIPEWAVGTVYEAGDKVTYKGVTYTCIQGHTAGPGWEPDVTANILWAPES